MSVIDLLLNRNNPNYLAKIIAENFKNKRIKSNFTQKDLAERSGITLSSLKRFEQKAEISLSNLLKLAIPLDAMEEFEKLFPENTKESLDDYLEELETKERQRVRKKKISEDEN